MKVIIEITPRGNIFDAVQADIVSGGNEDFHLTFESARLLFAELTPARLDLLDTPAEVGSVQRLRIGKNGRPQLLERSHRCSSFVRSRTDRAHN